MVQSMMYCSEQIAIPETFPNILKTYAKAVIRTQPYDLLRWSSAYFRCLAQNEAPPAKCRLEKEVPCGSLTRGYLRVLLDQVGKGFFISRELLQKKWEGLCLPEDELFRYLSVCRMLNWPQVHWLKLFGVMVGSLNKTPESTVTMLCELLTDDVEGGPAHVPMWMFRTVFTFLAELDCSVEQTFVNGRKKLETGKLEDLVEMDNIPKVFSATSLKQAIMSECLQRYNETYQKNDGPHRQSNKDENSSLDSSTISSSSVSSGFQFAGKLGDTKQIIRKCGDFDSLILLLREAQGAKLHDYEGPHHVAQVNIEHAKKREAMVYADLEQQAINQEQNAQKYLHQESLNMLREMGPPWSWIHQFATNNCADMSYNFIEERSIASDATPPESSDESFDFEKEKPITGNESEIETIECSTSSGNIEDLLKVENETPVPKADNKITDRALQEIRNSLAKAESEGEIDVSVTGSIISYINKDEMGVLLRAGERAAPSFDVKILEEILKEALKHGTIFESIDDVMDFVRSTYDDYTKDIQTDYFVQSGYYQTLQNEEKLQQGRMEDGICAEEEEVVSKEHSQHMSISVVPSGSVTRTASEISLESKTTGSIEADESAMTVVKEDTKKSSSEEEDLDDGDDKTIQPAGKIEPELVNEKTGTSKLVPDATKEESETVDIQAIGNMENVFETCGIEPAPKVLAAKIADSMILGLISKDPPEEVEEEEVGESTIDPSMDNDSQGGYLSDISNNVETTASSTDREIVLPHFICGVEVKNELEKPDYVCIVPEYPGIGKAVTKKTVQDFLTYLKFRSRSQKGMVLPRNFREDKCPNMVD